MDNINKYISTIIPLKKEMIANKKTVFNRETREYEKIDCVSPGITLDSLLNRKKLIETLGKKIISLQLLNMEGFKKLLEIRTELDSTMQDIYDNYMDTNEVNDLFILFAKEFKEKIQDEITKPISEVEQAEKTGYNGA